MSRRHTLVENPDGTRSLRESAGGQAMHSWIGPWAEANLLYVGQAGLEQRCARPEQTCVVFDVGLGLAANALALIERYRSTKCQGALKIVSFENDLDGLATALENQHEWDFVTRSAKILETLLARRSWAEGRIEWQLLEGDFRQTLAAAPRPDLIFWDFYDPKTCPQLWSVAVFEQLYRHCVIGNESLISTPQTRLLTYSASTPTRLGLLLAGFYVGKGPRTPVKNETSQAALRLEDLDSPLGPEWLDKLRRSAKASPYGESLALDSVLERVRLHPQFAGGPRS